MEDNIKVELSRDEIFILFNNLLVRERSALKSHNESCEQLLNKLWSEVKDRTKDQVLWGKNFRGLLDRWNVVYQADLVRLELPLNLK